MRRHNDARMRSTCRHHDVGAIKQASAYPRFRMNRLLIGRLSEASLHLRVRQQMVLSTPHHPRQSRSLDIDHDRSIPIESIQSHDPLTQGDAFRREIGHDDLQALQQLPSIVAISCSRKGSQPPRMGEVWCPLRASLALAASRPREPLMGVGLEERGSGSYHFPTFASLMASRTHLLQSSISRRKLLPVRQRSLSRRFPGSIGIKDHPSCSLSIPHPSRFFTRNRASYQIPKAARSQLFNGRFVQRRQKSTHRRAVRQVPSPKECHVC